MLVIHELNDSRTGGIVYDIVPDEYFATVPTNGNVDEWWDAIEGRTSQLEWADGDKYTKLYERLLSENKYVVVLDMHEDALSDDETMYFENVVDVFVNGVKQ